MAQLIQLDTLQNGLIKEGQTTASSPNVLSLTIKEPYGVVLELLLGIFNRQK